jgi:hypothetical protein
MLEAEVKEREKEANWVCAASLGMCGKPEPMHCGIPVKQC